MANQLWIRYVKQANVEREYRLNKTVFEKEKVITVNQLSEGANDRLELWRPQSHIYLHNFVK